MNNREDYLKDLETINAQIMAVEKEITDLDAKRAMLEEKILLEKWVPNRCIVH